MKGLENLLRLHKWRLEEKRRKVADLERLAGRLQGEIGELDASMNTERAAAARDPMSGAAYNLFLEGALLRRGKLRDSLAGVEVEMAAALEEVAEAFREFKKFDLIRERHERDANGRESRMQQAALDEAGLNLYRRRSA